MLFEKFSIFANSVLVLSVMGAPKRQRSTKDEEKLTAKQRKTIKHGVPAKKLHDEVEQRVDEHSEGEEAELVANTNTKLTVYDSLLKKLGTQNVSVADAIRRRQREEQGESDEDEEDEEGDSDPESIDELEENAADDDDEDDDDDADDGNNIEGNLSSITLGSPFPSYALCIEIKKLEVGYY